MSNKKQMKIEFAPGCFDGFEGTQEELDAFVAEIQRMADSGELEANAQPMELGMLLDDDELSEDDKLQILNALEFDDREPRTLQ